MRRLLILTYCLVITVVPLILLVWKYLPPFSPAAEVILSSQTVRLLGGIFFMLLGLISAFFSVKMRYFAGLSAVLSGLLIVQAMSYGAGMRREVYYPASKGKLTLYSHNVLYNGPCSVDLVKIVRDLSPDIAVFQEYDFSHAVLIGPYLRELGYEEVTAYNSPAEGAFAFAVYSKLPLRNHRIYYTEGPEWKPKWPNQYIEFQFGGDWIKLVNLHIVPPHNPMAGVYPYPSQQKYILWQLEEASVRLDKGASPAVICGDFNLTPSAKQLVHLRESFVDSWMESGGGFGATWHNPLPVFRIDYVFHSRHLRALSCRTIGNNFSDHRGIVVEMARE